MKEHHRKWIRAVINYCCTLFQYIFCSIAHYKLLYTCYLHISFVRWKYAYILYVVLTLSIEIHNCLSRILRASNASVLHINMNHTQRHTIIQNEFGRMNEPRRRRRRPKSVAAHIPTRISRYFRFICSVILFCERTTCWMTWSTCCLLLCVSAVAATGPTGRVLYLHTFSFVSSFHRKISLRCSCSYCFFSPLFLFNIVLTIITIAFPRTCYDYDHHMNKIFFFFSSCLKCYSSSGLSVLLAIHSPFVIYISG